MMGAGEGADAVRRFSSSRSQVRQHPTLLTNEADATPPLAQPACSASVKDRVR